jgi:light-regulated signal transduction histidine kinase (bacteriophytochrome)
MEAERLSEKGREYFKRISYAAERMKVLITDLLSFSRTSTAEKVYEPTDLNVLMKHVIDDLQDDLQRQLATIHMASLPVLNVIPFQVYQLFNNLLSNSLKFSRKEVLPLVEIKVQLLAADAIPYDLPAENTNYYHISCSDNGIGFLPEYRDRIFEVFQRLHGKAEYEGTGIGLAICKKIMANHQGLIIAEGSPGEGATFHLYFPENIT